MAYLRHKAVQVFSPGQYIYDPLHPPVNLYFVVVGRVKIAIISENGRQTITRLIGAEGLFGESCLIAGPSLNEAAVAVDDVTVMGWTRDQVERQIELEPRLGLALTQYLMVQCNQLHDRIARITTYDVPARLMLALAQFGSEFGTPVARGGLRVFSVTQRLIAEYIGSSRELVAQQMNRLRKIGVVWYSRKYIDVYLQAVYDELRLSGVTMPSYLLNGAPGRSWDNRTDALL